MYLLHRAFSAMAILSVVQLLVAFQPTALNGASQVKINEVTFTAVDYALSGPDTLPAGMTTFRIENKGKDLHQVQLIQLTNGKTVTEFIAALKDNPMILPDWVKFFGGPNGTVPGEASVATMNLQPGNYFVTCLIPDAKGTFHAIHGMIRPLTVPAASNPATAVPKADRVIELSKFNFKVSKPFTAGKQTIEVVNKGTVPHEVLLVELPPNASIQDFGKHFEPGAAAGPPPGKPIGGVSGMEKGQHGYFTVDLAPGHYGLICFFSDATTEGKSHFALGMAHEFTVK